MGSNINMEQVGEDVEDMVLPSQVTQLLTVNFCKCVLLLEIIVLLIHTKIS